MTHALRLWYQDKRVALAWDILLAVALCGLALIWGNQIAFFHQPNAYERGWDILVSLILFVDMFFANDTGSAQSKKLSEILAVIACLPLLNLLTWFDVSEPYFQMLLILRFAEVPHLSRRLRSQHINPMISRAFVSFILVLLFVSILHLIASLWIRAQPPEAGTDQLTAYNLAYYFLITTLTTIGYGDITPKTNEARVFTVVIEILGVGFYSIVIGKVSAFLNARDRRRLEQMDRLQSLRSFLQHYKIPLNVQSEVFEFYHHFLNKRLSDSEASILQDLPHRIQQDIKVFMHIQSLEKVRLFSGCSQECLVDVAKNLHAEFFGPNDQVIKKGDDGHEMFLISHGTVTVHDGSHVIAQLDAGACFGEMALIQDMKRNSDVSAVTFCDLYKLERSAFRELIDKYPDLRANAEALVAERRAG